MLIILFLRRSDKKIGVSVHEVHRGFFRGVVAPLRILSGQIQNMREIRAILMRI